MKDPRYDGKPLLRLIELWILWVIGEIETVDEARLKEMEPKLRATWKREGTWHELIQAMLDLPSTLPDELRAMWQRNLETARKQGAPPPREMFMKSIADQISRAAD
jgi:hypothetical protein